MIAPRALALARTHTSADIAEAVAHGIMQEWGEGDSVIITEIRDTPLAKYVHFFLAEGHMEEIQAMIPGILRWAKWIGCTRASLAGREGWRRVPWLLADGWEFKHIVLEKELG